MKFKNCNTYGCQIDDNSNFCTYCGSKQEKVKSEENYSENILKNKPSIINKPNEIIEEKLNKDDYSNHRKPYKLVIPITIIYCIITFLLCWITPYMLYLVIAGPIIAWFIYEKLYYEDNDFLEIKEDIEDYVYDFNDLNDYILQLKQKSNNVFNSKSSMNIGTYTDTSNYNFSRKGYKNIKHNKCVYNCTLQVCRNAQNKPFDYVCKYFNIKADEPTLNAFEQMFNDYMSVEQGITLLENKKQEIRNNIDNEIPFLIRKFSKSLDNRLGFENIKVSKADFPVCTFSYVSSGGNSSMHYDIEFNLDVIEQFISFLTQKIKFKKSAAGQRALMTKKLREEIKQRDHYICQCCGNSTNKEPNLLLEIDHIIPVSKGGLTEKDNLQTLCWKCNRSKGNKTNWQN